MNDGVRVNNQLLLDEVSLYLSFAEDAYIDRKPFIITEAHERIKKVDYEWEQEYYSDLTDYILSRL